MEHGHDCNRNASNLWSCIFGVVEFNPHLLPKDVIHVLGFIHLDKPDFVSSVKFLFWSIFGGVLKYISYFLPFISSFRLTFIFFPVTHLTTFWYTEFPLPYWPRLCLSIVGMPELPADTGAHGTEVHIVINKRLFHLTERDFTSILFASSHLGQDFAISLVGCITVSKSASAVSLPTCSIFFFFTKADILGLSTLEIS